MEMPKDFQNALDVHFYNGLGFFPGQGLSGGQFQLAFIHPTQLVQNIITEVGDSFKYLKINEDALTQYLRTHTTSTTVAADSWIGREYIAIHYTEWEKIPEVLNTVSGLGISYRIISKYSSSVNIYFPSNSNFSLAELERRFVEGIKSNVEQLASCLPDKDINSIYRETIQYQDDFCPLLQISNWSTPVGRDFCRHLLQLLNISFDFETSSYNPFFMKQYHAYCQKYNILHCGIWSGYVPLNINDQPLALSPQPALASQLVQQPPQSAQAPPQAAQAAQAPQQAPPAEEEEEKCMVCLENSANTIVFPCGHNVACKTCSDQLEKTPNENKCIKCRQTITEVCLISS